ncbi:DUF2087 domain-containing protein [Iodobacter fluviatilis]|uniref:DUF2087 domain-containing protein n=1 Tax=Iodobacter fluviatilis TaxID=537 RepID=A0A7G3GBF1_9NEIS|nr:DUF2087 domain-containing protein [Iodobacter fluviatilis]QBC44621.1 hypothetical protein C1H71_14530 [Iodobacter fluviatilis]
MSRTTYPFYTSDISALARSLKLQWAAEPAAPSHLQILNMLARAAGFSNFQHLRAAAEMPAPLTTSTQSVLTKRLLRHFNEQGCLIRWPKKFSEQLPCLWPVWANIPAATEMTEKAANEWIKSAEAIGDHVLLRRELVNYQLITRTPDCRVYQRLEQDIPDELAEFLAEIQKRKEKMLT